MMLTFRCQGVSSYPMFILLFLFILDEPEMCIASVFGNPGDKYAGGSALYLGRPVNNNDIGIAHRTLPIGSFAFVTHGDRTILVQVMDRGPYGAIGPDGKWFIKKRRSQPGRYRGCVDLTPKAAKLLDHDGWGKVVLWPIKQRNWTRKRRRSGV